MKKIFLFVLALCSLYAGAQQADRFPLHQFDELTDTKPHDDATVWEQLKQTACFSWGSTDVRYRKLDVPDISRKSSLRLKGWRGERVNAQAVLWTKADLGKVRIEISDLTNGKHRIPASAVKAGFVRYVMTDELNKDGQGGCGHRPNKADWDSSLVADMIDINLELPVKARTTQPIWMNV